MIFSIKEDGSFIGDGAVLIRGQAGATVTYKKETFLGIERTVAVFDGTAESVVKITTGENSCISKPQLCLPTGGVTSLTAGITVSMSIKVCRTRGMYSHTRLIHR